MILAFSMTMPAIDDQFILTWDAAGKLIGNWSLKRNADSSPKTLEIVDILSGDLSGEGQWAVSQKQLLLRLYPPRKTTSPYLSSIFSKPTNGDLVEFRFEKLPEPPPWLNSDSIGEIAAPFTEASARDKVAITSSADSALEGRWIPDAVQTEAETTSIMPGDIGGVWIFAGDWLLSVNPDGTIEKSVVTTRTDVRPKRIRIETKTEKELVVAQGVYRVDDKNPNSNKLQLYFVDYFSDTKASRTPLDAAELEKQTQKTIESLTDRCFDEPPESGAMLLRCRMSSEPILTRNFLPNVVGKILDTKPSKQNGKILVEVSVGADDGLKVGDMLQVYRATDSEKKKPYSSTMRLELVTPDRAVGVMSDEGIPFKKGDPVTTELY